MKMIYLQGALSAALSYLGQSNEDSIKELRDRLNGALGSQAQQIRKTSAKSDTRKTSWNSGGSGGQQTNTGVYTGIHNPAVDDLSVYNTPVPHYDHGGNF